MHRSPTPKPSWWEPILRGAYPEPPRHFGSTGTPVLPQPRYRALAVALEHRWLASSRTPRTSIRPAAQQGRRAQGGTPSTHGTPGTHKGEVQQAPYDEGGKGSAIAKYSKSQH
eukprot:507643-Amphidinium_carterae.1